MKNKKNYIILLIFTILVMIFTLKDNFLTIVNTILTMNIFWVLLGCLMMLGNWFFRAFILKRYIRKYNKNYSFKSAYKLMLETIFFNGVTPFSSGGQPFQVLMLKKDGLRVGQGTNIIFITSFIYQLSLFIVTTISIMLNQKLNLFNIDITIKYLLIIGYIINIVFILFLCLVIFNKKFKKIIAKLINKILLKMNFYKKRNILINKLEEHFIIMDGSLELIKNDMKGFFISLAENIFAIICFFIVPVCLSYAMGLGGKISSLEAIIATSYVELIGFFIPVPGGTGGTEYTFAVLFAMLISSTNAKSMMIVWRFITYYMGMILGSIVLNIDKRKD